MNAPMQQPRRRIEPDGAPVEGGLYLISATVMGGTEDFAVPLVVRIIEINAAAYAALIAAVLLITAAGSRSASPRRIARPASPH
jgi:hypothetical protein